MTGRHFAVLFLTLCLTPALLAQVAPQKYSIPESDDGLPGEGPIRRYDWFRNLWQQRRARWAKQAEADQGAVVFLGDSITQGWGDDLGNAFPGLKVANRGISGDTTRGMLLRLNEDVIALRPAAVVMLMGTNDLEEGATPKTIAGNVSLIVDALLEHNAKLPIVLCQVFPSSSSKKRSAEDIREVNRLTAEAMRGHTQVTVLDTWTLFANEQGDARPEEFPDLLHPNKAGYARWADALRPVLATLGFVETEADDFVIEPGYRSLFNGKDLTGWGFRASTEQERKAAERRRRNPKAPAWPLVEKDIHFDGQEQSSDGRYQVVNGRLVVTTPTEGRRIQQLWTTESFDQDFVLKLEFRATPNADSGVFIRGRQLQCRDYRLAGPFKNLKRYRPQDWNELVIRVSGTIAHCSCNGEVLEASFEVPASGPIGLEGDRGQMEYRRIRVGPDDGNLLRTTNRVGSWTLETTGDGTGSVQASGDSIVFTTTRTTNTDWHVQAYQQHLDLTEGAEYRVSFDLKSPDYATVVVLAMIHEPDYHSIGLAAEVAAGPQFETHEFTFTATDTVKGNNRIGFVLGRGEGTVVVRNFTLVEVK